ncbi:hypothetical protein ACFE04_002735 [Oxalis oulophora]
MALLFTRLRNFHHLHHYHGVHRRLSSSTTTSSVLSPYSSTTLTSKQKKRETLSLLISEQDPNYAVDICRSGELSPESYLDRYSFSILIKKLSKDNNFSAIHQFLQELKHNRNDLKTERFVSLSIILYGQANMMEHALRAFKDLHEGKEIFKGSIKSLNALLLACYLAKDYARAKCVFLDFPRIYNLQPDRDTYITVIKVFCKSGDSSLCYSVLEKMDRKGMKPDTSLLSTLLAGFYREEKFKDVGKVLDFMKDKYGFDSELSTYNVRIHGLCKLKRSAEAEVLYEEMCSKGMEPNHETFDHLIRGFRKEGNLEEAKKMFKLMVESNCEQKSGCYLAMVYFLCRWGDYEAALSVCRQSMDKGWVPQFRIMISLVEGLTKTSKAEEAKRIITEMKMRSKDGWELWTEVEACLFQ